MHDYCYMDFVSTTYNTQYCRLEYKTRSLPLLMLSNSSLLGAQRYHNQHFQGQFSYDLQNKGRRDWRIFDNQLWKVALSGLDILPSHRRINNIENALRKDRLITDWHIELSRWIQEHKIKAGTWLVWKWLYFDSNRWTHILLLEFCKMAEVLHQNNSRL